MESSVIFVIIILAIIFICSLFGVVFLCRHKNIKSRTKLYVKRFVRPRLLRRFSGELIEDSDDNVVMNNYLNYELKKFLNKNGLNNVGEYSTEILLKYIKLLALCEQINKQKSIDYDQIDDIKQVIQMAKNITEETGLNGITMECWERKGLLKMPTTDIALKISKILINTEHKLSELQKNCLRQNLNCKLAVET